MTALTFDTLRYANKLKAAGVPEKQAEAEAEALADVMSDAVKTADLVTKNDMLLALAEMKTDLMKWVIGMALAQIGLLVGVLMRLPH